MARYIISLIILLIKINIFIPGWTIPPIYYVLRRKSIKSTPIPSRCMAYTINSREIIPIRERPIFAALEEMISRGLLSNEMGQYIRAHINLKILLISFCWGPSLDNMVTAWWIIHWYPLIVHYTCNIIKQNLYIYIYSNEIFQDLAGLLYLWYKKRDYRAQS